MTFTYLIDTNTFSYIANGASPAARAEFKRLLDDPDADLCISVITEAEVRYGMAKRSLSRSRCAAIEGLFATLTILPWGSEEAETYGKARAAVEKQGITVSLMDLLITSQAAATGATLVTRDAIFSKIGQLADLTATVNWATDI